MPGRDNDSVSSNPSSRLLNEIVVHARLTRGTEKCDRVTYDDLFFFSISCSVFACVLAFFAVLYFGETFMPKEPARVEKPLEEKVEN